MAEFAQAIKNVIDPELRVSEPPPIPNQSEPRRRKSGGVGVTPPMIFISVSLILVVICARRSDPGDLANHRQGEGHDQRV